MDNFKKNGCESNNENNAVENSTPEVSEAEKETFIHGTDSEAATDDKTQSSAQSAEADSNANNAADNTPTVADANPSPDSTANPNVTYHYTGGTERPFASQTPPPRYGAPGTPYPGAQYNAPGNAPGQGYTQGQGYTAGGYNNGSARVYPPHIPTDPPKKEKKRSGLGAGAIALLCACGILVSGGTGFLGAMAANSMNKNGTPTGGGSAVIYKNPETGTLDGDDAPTPSTSLEHVAAAVSDSVVEIVTEFKAQSSMFQYVTEGAGSGVIISPDGYIVTNNHVIVNSSGSSNGQVADTITIRLRNGDKYTAELIGRDADADIAVLKVDAEGLTSAVIGNSDSLNVGTDVVAVGNPLGELGGTVTNGIISALDREIDVDGVKMNLLQTNAAVNPGNSGGGLFNMNGELIGIVNAKSSGTGVEGLGFAIPVNDAMDIVEQLMDYGYVRGKVYIGVSFYNATDAYSAYHYFKSQSTGIYVYKAEEGYNDGALKYGDRIIAIDGAEVTSVDSIKSILKEHSVGDTLTFTVYRDNKLTETTVTCYESKPADGDVSFETN